MQAAAAHHAVRSAQVVLRWAVQKGWSVVPKSGSLDRLRSNQAIFGVALTQGEVAAIDAMSEIKIKMSEPRPAEL